MLTVEEAEARQAIDDFKLQNAAEVRKVETAIKVRHATRLVLTLIVVAAVATGVVGWVVG